MAKKEKGITAEKRFRLLWIALGLLMLVLVASVIIICVLNFKSALKESRQQSVTAAAKLAVKQIDGDKIDGWLENGVDDDYKLTAERLNDILNNTSYLEYLYVYKILPDGCHVVFDFWSPQDAETDGLPEVDISAIGEVLEFDPSFEPYIPDLLAGKRIDIIESDDAYGWLLTQYEPIYDSQGKCVAYVGVDISVHEIRQYIRSIIIKIAVIAAVVFLICIFIGVRLSVMFRRAEKMDALIEKQKRDKALLAEFIEAFASVIDLKDSYTQGHSFRVAKYTEMLARELGCDEETVERYHNIALLHDVGKIGIPDSVLNKPGPLSDEEFNIIRSHAARGYKVLKNISLMPDIAVGAGSHHERPDGKGYPKGLKGDEIPRVAQIIAVADCFDAMYSDRPYRKRMNFERAVSIIREVSGTQLTPDVVDAFLRLVDKGEFRAPDDHGGGSMESIDNIHQKNSLLSKGEKKAEQ